MNDDSRARRGDEDTIPAPFDEVPILDAPTEEDREHAQLFFPPRAVPEEGPIPDYHHVHATEQDVVVPEWALEAARYRLRLSDPDKVDRFLVQDVLLESAQIYEQFVTPDGRDAAEVLLEEVRGDEETWSASRGDEGHD